MIIRAFLLIFFVTFVFVITAFLNPIPVRQIRTDYRPLYCVSYSFEQAGWYGHNPLEDYVEMLEEFEFDWVRLPFFWNQMVHTATGAKTPYFPEYHWPREIEDQVKFGEIIDSDHQIADDILAMDGKVIDELSAFDNIRSEEHTSELQSQF